jgi:hypothetical protein
MSLKGLIRSATDRNPEILAEQQRAHATVGYKRDVCTREALQDLIDSGSDSGLGIKSTLPSPDAFLRP